MVMAETELALFVSVNGAILLAQIEKLRQ